MDIFNSEPAPSEGEELLEEEPQEVPEEEPQEVPASQGEEIPKKRIENTKEWFQSQYDKTQKELAAERELRVREKEELTQQFEGLKKDLEGLKNPPKPEEVLVEPMPPKPLPNYDKEAAYTDPTSESFRWRVENDEFLRQEAEYNRKLRAKEIEKISKLEKELENERKLKESQKLKEAEKAYLLGELAKYGTQEEAMRAYAKYTAPGSVTAERIMALLRLEEGNGVPKSPKPEKEKFPLPAGISGAADVNLKDSDTLINSMGANKFKTIFDTK